jgi:hypothetical protein
MLTNSFLSFKAEATYHRIGSQRRQPGTTNTIKATKGRKKKDKQKETKTYMYICKGPPALNLFSTPFFSPGFLFYKSLIF